MAENVVANPDRCFEYRQADAGTKRVPCELRKSGPTLPSAAQKLHQYIPQVKNAPRGRSINPNSR